ncbi:MAG TPA: SDR family oxidoreductase [Acidimicrobiales bacterium]|nr:SDR family oxidoreductase [Acidimicrobiales bacterium]
MIRSVADKVVLISGANSGIGRATAALLASEGARVHAGMRDTAKAAKLMAMAEGAPGPVTPVTLDVTSDESVSRAVDDVLAAEGRIDILVNNAGVGYNAVAEDIDIEEAKGVFEVNYWGIIRMIKAAVPHMRAAGSGHVVNVSSVAGRIAAIGQSVYSSSKWAVESLSEGLAQELAPHGIGVSIIEPGVTRTAILPKNEGHPSPTAYETAYRRMFDFYAAGVAAGAQPGEVAEIILEALTTDQPRLRWTAAWGGRELPAGRAAMTDEQWVDLARCDSDEEYAARFTELFGLEL